VTAAPANLRPVRPFEVTHAMVARLAAPMTLAYMSTPLLGIADTAVVGRLGDPALLGGLAVGAVLVDLVFTTFNFQRAGTTALAAQAHGSGDEPEKQAVLARALLLSVCIGVAAVALVPAMLWLGLYFMAPEAGVAAATQSYFTIRMLSTPLALANYAMLGWLIGLGRTGSALGLQTLLNGLNIVLSVLFGLTLGYGIAGVAWATVASELVAALAGLAICRGLLDPAHRPSRTQVLRLDAFRRLVRLNADIMVRSFVLLGAFAFFTAQGARFGTVTLAANAVLMHFFMIGGFFLDGLATAAEQIVGRAVGANYREGFLRGARLSFVWNFALALALTLVFLVFGETLVALLTTSREVRDAAGQWLWLAALTPIAGVVAFQFDGIYIGATWSRDMARMMVVSFAIYIFAWWMLAGPLGNTGLWLALHVFLLARAVTLGLRFAPNLRTTFPA
jgi:MATE family multidrug resistance protein